MSETAYVIIDTNILLHFKQLDQIDWRALCGAARVDLVLSALLLRELSKAKDMSPSKGIRNRARTREKWIFGRLSQRAEPIRPGVYVRPNIQETRHKLQELDLDPAVNDNLFIALLAIYRDQGHDARIATADGGLRLQLDLRDLPFLWMDDEHRQETEPDPEKVRADNAERELRDVKNRLPVLVVEGTTPWKVQRQIGLGDCGQYVKKQLMLAEARRASKNPALIRMFGHPHVSFFEPFYASEVASTRIYLEQQHRWLSVTENASRIRVVVQNSGTLTATDLRLQLTFPRHLLPYGQGGFGQPPTVMFQSIVAAHLPEAENRLELAGATGFTIARENAPVFNREAGTVSLKWSQLQHHDQVASIDFWMTAPSGASLGRTSVQTAVLCAELGTAITGHIPVDVTEPEKAD